MNIDTNAVLESLKDGKTAKTQSSLDTLNQTLKDYYESGARDFSITTIGRVSEENDGVGYQSIRATANKHYRDLIEAWAAKAKTTTKKPPVGPAKRPTQDHQLLERIDDTAVRALFGQIIRERDRYRSEATCSRPNQIVIDKRPTVYSEPQSDTPVWSCCPH
ncbi:gamma-mobile-trio protein GmtX [Providencia sp. PROV170]|uniref:gamma-mobile-trio protein GmtX n=1 Tax=Providencia sp. PROV170 TaxID=2936792 RepID=UPI0029905449|nr:gamma-mobile-trio protein GmtX [Providencia sp. PROV170]